MMSDELVVKMKDNLEKIADQIAEAEPGSDEQLTLVKCYKELNSTVLDEQKVTAEYERNDAAKEEAKFKREEDVKERKWRHKIDVAGIVVPALTGLSGLAAVLLFEVKDVVTSSTGRSWIGKVLKWTK